jgi:hypothetical protein
MENARGLLLGGEWNAKLIVDEVACHTTEEDVS